MSTVTIIGLRRTPCADVTATCAAACNVAAKLGVCGVATANKENRMFRVFPAALHFYCGAFSPQSQLLEHCSRKANFSGTRNQADEQWNFSTGCRVLFFRFSCWVLL